MPTAIGLPGGSGCGLKALIGLPGGSGCGLKACAVPEASPNATSATPSDRSALPASFFTLWVVVVFFPSVVSAVVAGHVKGAADALAESWKLQDEWGATPLGKTGRLSHPSSPFDATWKGSIRRGRELVSRLVGEAEELITGRPGERIGSNDDDKVPA
jgi:hypothetical protein